jgi:hypothetical protein
MLLLCALGLWIGCGIRLCISTAATQEPPPPLGDASHDWHLSSDELLHQAVLERLFDPVAGPGRVQQTREALGLGLHGAEEGKDEDWDWEEERDDDPRGPRGPWVLEGGDGKDRRINRGGTTSTTAATPHLIQGMSAGEAAADGSAEDPPVQMGNGANDQHSLRALSGPQWHGMEEAVAAASAASAAKPVDLSGCCSMPPAAAASLEGPLAMTGRSVMASGSSSSSSWESAWRRQGPGRPRCGRWPVMSACGRGTRRTASSRGAPQGLLPPPAMASRRGGSAAVVCATASRRLRSAQR